MNDNDQSNVVPAFAEPASQHQISLAALHEYVEKACNGNSQLIACAESCYYWFNKNIVMKEKNGTQNQD